MYNTLPPNVGLEIADAAVLSTTSRHLSPLEILILQGALQGKPYDEIAAESGYSPEYLKNNVGPRLWKLLSRSLGERVSKKNLMVVLARRAKAKSGSVETAVKSNSPAVPPSKSSVPQSQTSQIAQPNLMPPSAKADLESPRQIAAPSSALYVMRPPIEAICCQKLAQPGALVRIKAPSQMGKTSLMLYSLNYLQQQGCRIVPLSLQRVDRDALTSLDKFLRWFCTIITHRLQLPHQVNEYWRDTYGSKSNCTNYFEDCLLSETDRPLLLALDQVDTVFPYPDIADDFFSLLRSWYEEAAYGTPSSMLWQNLRLLIVHSTEVYIPLETNKSPFNVGLAVDLPPFTPEQVQDLAQRHGLRLTEAQLQYLEQLLSGHPYLIRLALYHLARQEVTWTQLKENAATDAGIYHSHLHRHLGHLQEHPELATAYAKVVRSQTAVAIPQMVAFKLHSMGLIQLEGNTVAPSCQLYRQYFCDRLGQLSA
jgi:hypothetical protein